MHRSSHILYHTTTNHKNVRTHAHLHSECCHWSSSGWNIYRMTFDCGCCLGCCWQNQISMQTVSRAHNVSIGPSYVLVQICANVNICKYYSNTFKYRTLPISLKVLFYSAVSSLFLRFVFFFHLSFSLRYHLFILCDEITSEFAQNKKTMTTQMIDSIISTAAQQQQQQPLGKTASNLFKSLSQNDSIGSTRSFFGRTFFVS